MFMILGDGSNSTPSLQVTQMSTRVDMLEAAIQDIINGENVTPTLSLPPTPNSFRRSDSASMMK
jgi:hypothetical protein